MWTTLNHAYRVKRQVIEILGVPHRCFSPRSAHNWFQEKYFSCTLSLLTDMSNQDINERVLLFQQLKRSLHDL